MFRRNFLQSLAGCLGIFGFRFSERKLVEPEPVRMVTLGKAKYFFNSGGWIYLEEKDGIRQWFDQAGELHREDGPAREYADGSEQWWRHGKLHRVGGPAYTKTKQSIYQGDWRNGAWESGDLLTLGVREWHEEGVFKKFEYFDTSTMSKVV